MTEGKGYCARRQERMSAKNLAKLIKNRDKLIMIPDIKDVKT